MSIYSIGEALIDFMPQGDVFLPAVGGAPANVAACVAKLGGRSHFIGKVGDDIFGKKIIRIVVKCLTDETLPLRCMKKAHPWLMGEEISP